MRNFLVCFILLIIFGTVTHAVKRQCQVDDDCNGKGVCNDEGTCNCNKGYLTYDGYVQYGRRLNVNCKYKQKEKLTAFLLSLIIGSTGADWYYLNAGNPVYVLIGVVKCMMSIIGVVAKIQGKKKIQQVIIHRVFGNKLDGRTNLKLVFIVLGILLLGVVNFSWWLADWVRILMNTFIDGSGQPLLDW